MTEMRDRKRKKRGGRTAAGFGGVCLTVFDDVLNNSNDKKMPREGA